MRRRSRPNRRKRPLWETSLSGWFLILLLLGLWQLSVDQGWVRLVSWPRFSDVAQSWGSFLTSGEIVEVIGPTLGRLSIGYAIAVVVGISLGSVMGAFTAALRLLEPIVEILRPTPAVALIPILILFLGLGNEMKVTVIVYAAMWPILVSTLAGVRSVDAVQVNTARTLGLRRRQILTKVVLPAASPHIVAGMRIGLGIALIAVIVIEMVSGGGGLGFYVLDTQRSFRVVDTYVGVITIGMLGYMLNRVFRLVEGRLMKWHAELARLEPS